MMSNLQLLALFMALIFSPVESSRECYGCTSEVSLEDCDKDRTIVKCSNDSQACATFSIYTLTGEKEQIYLRGCVQSSCSTSDFEDCHEPDVKCKLSCCSSELCNGAPGPVVNGLLLIGTASFMYLFRF